MLSLHVDDVMCQLYAQQQKFLVHLGVGLWSVHTACYSGHCLHSAHAETIRKKSAKGSSLKKGAITACTLCS